MKQHLRTMILSILLFVSLLKADTKEYSHLLWNTPEITVQGHLISFSGTRSVISRIRDSEEEVRISPFILLAGGSLAKISRFREFESNDIFLLPLEIAVSPLYNDYFSFSANTVFSIFSDSENDFTALNLSFGASAFLHNTRRLQFLPMTGAFVTLYPVFELPIIAGGKTPYYNWRSALDLGYSFLAGGLAQMTVYVRNIVAVREKKPAYFIDVGIAFGLRSGIRVFNELQNR